MKNPVINQSLTFKFKKTIIFYDGPLLSLGITEDNEAVLEVWVDENSEKRYSKYSYIFLKKEDFEPFIHDQKSYHDVIQDSRQIVYYKHDGKSSYDFEEIDPTTYLEEYGPTKSVSLQNDLIMIREHLNMFYLAEKRKQKINNQ